mgnify:CR=1 FL=1
MTALLEFKQKLKGLYAQYEIYLLPLLKFILAAVLHGSIPIWDI